MEVIVIFDIGKTNKKILLFDQTYSIVKEEYFQPNEIKDEDGDECEDISILIKWITNSFSTILSNPLYTVIGLNFSTFGASFIHINDRDEVITPLYSYMKKYDTEILSKFLVDHNQDNLLKKTCASPIMGMLNSGLQLYRLKLKKIEVFEKIKYSLHLPQYFSFLFTQKPYSDYTSIGCHTMLWNYNTKQYHNWTIQEKIDTKLAPITPSSTTTEVSFNKQKLQVGIGLHDSSASLIPYIKSFEKPFILLSTGTWNISMNPFNNSVLTQEELNNDCLQFLSPNGQSVKASRLFMGKEHETNTNLLAKHFNQPNDYFKNITLNNATIIKVSQLKNNNNYFNFFEIENNNLVQQENREKINLSIFDSYEEAYHKLMIDLSYLQAQSILLVANEEKDKNLLLSGGFCKNQLFLQLLLVFLKDYTIYTSHIDNASALGSAIVLDLFRKNTNSEKLVTYKKVSTKYTANLNSVLANYTNPNVNSVLI